MSETRKAAFGRLLREHRDRLGTSQEELGRLLGVDGTTVGRWEAGELLPRKRRIPALARALACRLDMLESAWNAARSEDWETSIRAAAQALSTAAKALISKSRPAGGAGQSAIVRAQDLDDLGRHAEEVQRLLD